MTRLARKLSLWNYFALGFGTMIGTGWVILMDDWLGRGGPLGAVVGFLMGGILLLPIGYVYGQWVRRRAGAGGAGAVVPRGGSPVWVAAPPSGRLCVDVIC